jgi:hypothetical protein
MMEHTNYEEQKLTALVTEDIDELEELLNLREKYGILRFFHRTFWKLVGGNWNRLTW